MTDAHDAQPPIRRVNSSPDLSGPPHAASRPVLKRAHSAPDAPMMHKRARVLADVHSACLQGTRDVKIDSESTPAQDNIHAHAGELRGTHQFATHLQFAQPSVHRAQSAAPSSSPALDTPDMAFSSARSSISADSSSLASLSPLSDSPLDDVFDPAHDMHVSAVAVWTPERVCAHLEDAPAALPAVAVDQQHSVRGTFSPIVPLLSQLSCPTVLAQIGLSIGSSSDPIASVSSLVTVSSKQELQLRCSTSVYAGGVLMATHEDQVLPFHRSNNVNTHEYSVPLAPDLLARLLINHQPIIPNHDSYDTTDTTDLHDTIPPLSPHDDTLAVLRFQSQGELGQQKIVLVLACQFSLVHSDEGFVKLLRPVLLPLTLLATPLDQPALLPSPTILSSPAFGSAQDVGIEELPFLAPLPKRAKRPNLTVTIPSADRYMVAAAGRGTPGSAGGRSGLMLQLAPPAASPMPITPVEQMMHTPADPPPLNRADEQQTVRARRFWAPTPTEANYPASMSMFYFDRAADSPAPRTPLYAPMHLSTAAGTPTFPNVHLPAHAPPPGAALASPYKFGLESGMTFEFGGVRKVPVRRATEL